MVKLYIGCSGFNYRDWKGNFYPEKLAQRKWLEYYSSVFGTVELNVTFYRLPLAKTFETWRNTVPANFAFALKGSRYITHIKRLNDVDEPVRNFFDNASMLEKKFKVVLWQFPPGFKADIGRLENFLKLLSNYRVRHTFEFRNESWMNNEVSELCKKYTVSLCMADAPRFLDEIPQSADFVYVRRHGVGGNYASDYPEDDLKNDARRIRKYLSDSKDVFIYFNNDAHGYAPKNARQLIDLLK